MKKYYSIQILLSACWLAIIMYYEAISYIPMLMFAGLSVAIGFYNFYNEIEETEIYDIVSENMVTLSEIQGTLLEAGSQIHATPLPEQKIVVEPKIETVPKKVLTKSALNPRGKKT